MIIYGSFTETSVAKLFMAGVIPGVMLTLMFMGYIGGPREVRPVGCRAVRPTPDNARYVGTDRHRAVRAADRRDHGQHLRRLGHPDRGRVRWLRLSR